MNIEHTSSAGTRPRLLRGAARALLGPRVLLFSVSAMALAFGLCLGPSASASGTSATHSHAAVDQTALLDSKGASDTQLDATYDLQPSEARQASDDILFETLGTFPAWCECVKGECGSCSLRTQGGPNVEVAECVFNKGTLLCRPSRLTNPGTDPVPDAFPACCPSNCTIPICPSEGCTSADGWGAPCAGKLASCEESGSDDKGPIIVCEPLHG